MIGLINYGSGNFKSVANVLNFLEINFLEITNYKQIKLCSHIILPGVGTYNDLISRLKKMELLEELKYQIKDKKSFYLGICVGMQILSEFGNENEITSGLNLMSGSVEKIPTKKLSLPNIGWHNLFLNKKESMLFDRIHNNEMFFYFVHSYYFKTSNKSDQSSYIEYENQVTASVERENIYGVQFHPEKSQVAGCKLLKNFCKI